MAREREASVDRIIAFSDGVATIANHPELTDDAATAESRRHVVASALQCWHKSLSP
jgi:hypothetical protein